MNKTALLLLPATIAAIFLLSSCSSLFRDTPEKQVPPQEKELTVGEITKMSPAEFRAYQERRSKRVAAEQEARDKKAKSFVDEMDFSRRASKEKRERLGDVSQPLNDDEQPGVFPWRSSSSERRSSTLTRDHF